MNNKVIEVTRNDIYDVVVLVYITFVVHDAQMYCVYIKMI